jgi:hypothetical protein
MALGTAMQKGAAMKWYGVLVLALLGGCEETETRPVAETAFDAPVPLNGCCVHDLDPRYPGNEIVAVGLDGFVFVVHREGDGWKHEVIGRTEGEVLQCAVGDFDPTRKGNELVVVGMKEGPEGPGDGAAHVFRFDPDEEKWTKELVHEEAALIHGVCVTDLDRSKPGEEILVVGFAQTATMIHRDGERWKAERIAELGGAGKNAVGFDGGAAVACTDGTIVHVSKSETGWRTRILDRAPAGQARIGTDGRRILAARDDGALGLVDGDLRTDIHREKAKLRGAVLADLDPDAIGIEAATCGYMGDVTLLHLKDGRWSATRVFHDDAPLHHLAAGELIAESKGLELVVASHSKRLTVIRRKS